MNKQATDLIAAVQKAKQGLINFRHILLTNSKDEVEPAPFHQDWSDLLLEDTEHTAIQGFRESAKALPLDTEIPTRHGFKTINEISIGDIVYDLEGKESAVIAVSEVFKDKDCYKIYFDDGTDIVCSADHL